MSPLETSYFTRSTPTPQYIGGIGEEWTVFTRQVLSSYTIMKGEAFSVKTTDHLCRLRCRLYLKGMRREILTFSFHKTKSKNVKKKKNL